MHHRRPKIAFVSPHCLVDFTNGAATATRDGLKLLAAQGFECLAFCGTRLDEAREGLIQEQFFRRGVKYQVRNSQIGQYRGRLIFLVEDNVPITLFENGSTRGAWLSAEEAKAFLTACDIFLRKNRPNLVITYGGDPVSIAVQHLAKRHGAKVVFWLHNFAYPGREPFAAADRVIVGSEFSKRYYCEKLGLDCHVLPYIVHWKEANVVGSGKWQVGSGRNEGKGEQRYVTFINPEQNKGVYVFARIASELARRRPDIPLLVTQGRSRADALHDPTLGLGPHLAAELDLTSTEGDSPIFADTKIGTVPDGRNMTTMPFTPDPQAFYPAVFSRTKLLLMPSLWLESFGLGSGRSDAQRHSRSWPATAARCRIRLEAAASCSTFRRDTRRKRARCRRRRKWRRGSRRSSAYGTTRPITSNAALPPGSAPKPGIPTASPRSTATSSAGSRGHCPRRTGPSKRPTKMPC